MRDLEQIAQSIIRGNAEQTERLTRKVFSQGKAATEILNKGMIRGMKIVSEKFMNNEFFLPEVLMAAHAMKAGMKILSPELSRSSVPPTGKVVIGTVEGDLHDIGKNIVRLMLEGAGFQVIDLGINVSAQKFSTTVKDNQPDILAMSALLTTTMTRMEDVIQNLRNGRLRDTVKVIVGGAPLSKEYANDIGADAYAADAGSAVFVCQELTGKG